MLEKIGRTHCGQKTSFSEPGTRFFWVRKTGTRRYQFLQHHEVASGQSKMNIAQVNSFSQEDFIEKFGNVVESSPMCAAAISQNRPFHNISELYYNLCEFIDALPLICRTAILRCYPDLAGRLAKTNALTAESTHEHASAGLDTLSYDEARVIGVYNKNYRQKFGFPFVICARLNNKETIINGLKSRMKNVKEKELKTGIEEVKKIMLLRLKDLVKTDSNL